MDKALENLMNGTFNLVKGPVLSILMLSIVVSLVRHPPSRLSEPHRRALRPPQ
ncbi:MAG TPA: hypothetical protein VFA57_13895 [Pseudolabrys sp.]|jgi:hypothetical protein|nr:hypothetical protein [Pseudolabrys sp.]